MSAFGDCLRNSVGLLQRWQSMTHVVSMGLLGLRGGGGGSGGVPAILARALARGLLGSIAACGHIC